MILNIVKHSGGNVRAVRRYASVNDFAEVLFVDEEIDFGSDHAVGIRRVTRNKSEILGNGMVKYYLAECGGNKRGVFITVNRFLHTDFNRSMKTEIALLISHNGFVFILKDMTRAGFVVSHRGKII